MTALDRVLPRLLTLPKGAPVETIVSLLNEWTRDVYGSLQRLSSESSMPLLRPTEVRIRSSDARPWDMVLVDASRGPLEVRLPAAKDVRGGIVGVVNVSSAATAVTVRSSRPRELINGAATHTIAIAYGARWFVSTGEAWFTVSTTGGAEPTPPESNVLWQWNGTDVSQFELESAGTASAVGATVDPTPAIPSAPPYTLGTLGVVANTAVPGGQVLRASMEIPSGMSALAQGVLFLTVADLDVDRFIIELTQVNISAANRYVGVGWYGSFSPGSPPASYAYCRLWSSGSGNLMRVDAHEPTITATTTAPNLITDGAGFARIVVDGDRGGTGLPRFRTHDFGFRDTSSDGAGSTAGGSTSQADWPSEPAGAGWASSPQSRLGLAMRVAGGLGTGVTHTWDIAAIRVLRHPLDT